MYIQELLGIVVGKRPKFIRITCPDEIGITRKTRQKFVSPLDYLDIEGVFQDLFGSQDIDRNT